MLVWGQKRDRPSKKPKGMQQGGTCEKRVKHNHVGGTAWVARPQGEAHTMERPQSEDACLRRSKRARAPNTQWE
eukprot:965464-Prorocentrum_minimum.AAC.1